MRYIETLTKTGLVIFQKKIGEAKNYSEIFLYSPLVKMQICIQPVILCKTDLQSVKELFAVAHFNYIMWLDVYYI